VRIVGDVIGRPDAQLDAEMPGGERGVMVLADVHQSFVVLALGHDARGIARHFHGRRRQRRRIEAAAHGDADPAGRQAIGHGARQQFAEALVVGLGFAKIQRFREFESPVAAKRQAALAERQQVRRGNPLYVAIDRALEFPRHAEDQKVGDPVVVERGWSGASCGEPVERIADQPGIGGPGVEQSAHAQPVAYREQTLALVVPQREGEVAGQVIGEGLAPPRIGQQAQPRIRGGRGGTQSRAELVARVEPDASDEPVATVQRVAHAARPGA